MGSAWKDQLKGNDNRFRDYVSSTSINGVASIFNRSFSRIRRLFLLLIFLGCCCGCLYTVIDRIKYYASYPSSTSVSFSASKDGLMFPAVTVCNLNLMNKT